MELRLVRKTRTANSTVGDLYIDTALECNTLEDTDRHLSDNMSLDSIKNIKVHSATAIPIGKYEVTITHSNRFGKDLPLLLNVPGFEGIRIHSGNTAADTEGCILVGTKSTTKDFIASSRDAFNKFYPKLQAALKQGKVYITIS